MTKSRRQPRSRERGLNSRVGGLAAFRADASWQFWLLAAFLCAVFAMGGAVRIDGESLIVLRPLSAIVLGVGCITLQGEQIGRYRYLFALGLACIALIGLQLVPVPAAVFAAMPGRALATAIYQVGGNGEIWRPLSLVPPRTWNALWAAMTPLAVLVLGTQLKATDLQRLLPVMIALGLASAALSVLQIVSDPHSPVYLYESQHVGWPIGLFDNRNHNAVFLASLLVMLAVWVDQRHARPERADRSRSSRSRSPSPSPRTARQAGEHGSNPIAGRIWRTVVAFATGFALLLIILDSGSRSGLVIALLACLSIPILRRGDREEAESETAIVASPGWQRIVARSRRFGPIFALLAGIGFIVSAVWLGRAESINRLLGLDTSQDIRFQILPTVRTMTGQFWPLGSGAGTFLPVYRVFEPDSLLSPFHMAQANNDWLEVALMAGLPGVFLLVLAVFFWLARARTVFSRDRSATQFARLGLLIILFLGLASATDYPLRVPSISCLIVVAALWSLMRDGRAQVLQATNYPTGGGLVAP